MNDSNDPANSVVVERSLNAPIDLVWRMWTDPEHFKAWYGPQGATIPVANFDLCVGGNRFVGMDMVSPNGPMRMWFTGQHLVVTEPGQLAYTESMSDADGNVQSPAAMGMPEGHPTTTEVRVDLVASEEHTNMVLTHVGIPPDSPGAMGWNMAFDKLVAYLDAQIDH
jgi:uncharacterized protein YndB with AHSA1/START domain